MNKHQIQDTINKYLDTLPEIVSCSIHIRSGIFLNHINNTSLYTSTNKNVLKIDSNKQASNLVESGIKEGLLLEINKTLRIIYKRLDYVPMMPIVWNYIAKE